ncbi:MAG TPA: amidase [Solibacterales bacterium]|nr:amidase [Bryobacterales bacterium]
MPGITNDVFFATITELGAGLRAKQFSCVELTRAFLDRMEKLGPRFNALALLLREDAVKQAKDVDDDLSRDRQRGPLQGIPCGVKDLLALRGHPTTWGAKPYAGQVLESDASVIKRLKKANAVLTSKLAMVELAGGPSYRYAAASLTGPGLNPWDRSRWSGGSSSGSGSAVAAGLVAFALGSETSGSILTPSAYCGITGLRPTYGLVSRAGAMALSWTMDKIGPMCRSAEDCSLVLQTIAGSDPADPASARKSYFHSPKFWRKFEDLKTGFAAVDFDEWPEPAMREPLRKALGVLKEMGLPLVDAKLPELPYGPVTSTIIAAEAASIFEPLMASGKVEELADAKQIAGLRAGLEIKAKDYLKAMRIRTEVQDAFRLIFSKVDVIAAPARTNIASKVSDPLDRPPQRELPKEAGFSRLIPAGNLAGLPALSLPCGFAEGMPVAIQLVGRPFSESNLIAIGMEFQRRTDFHRRRPEL